MARSVLKSRRYASLVGGIYYDFEADEILLVERSRSVGMGHCCRQLRYLQKPHHGSMYVALTGSSALSTDTP